MESSNIELSKKEKSSLDDYRIIVSEITRIQNLLQRYREDPNSLEEESYFDLLKKISYLRGRQSTTNPKIRSLYRKLYKKE